MQPSMVLVPRLVRRPVGNAWSDTAITGFARSEANYRISEGGDTNAAAMSYRGRASGRYYMEVAVSAVGNFNCALGIRHRDEHISVAITAGNNCAARSDGTTFVGTSGATAGTSTSFASGDRVMLALDVTAAKLWVGKNGSWFNSGDPAAGSGALFSGFGDGEWCLYAWTDNDGFGSHQMDLYNGQEGAAFAHAVPAGFERGMRY
jgi:hypothetical protein